MQKQEYEDMFHSEDTMWWYVGLRDAIYTTIKSLGKKNLAILDAGCGTGKNSEFLLKNGFKVKSIDLSDEAILLSKLRKIKAIQKASITKIPFKKDTFDVVICTDVLGALQSDDDTKQAISEFYRVLRKGGLVIIQCAALEWLRSQHDDVINFRKRYKRQELEQYFTNSHWTILKLSYRVFFMFLPIMLVKVIKKFTHKSHSNSKTDQYVPPNTINTFLTAIQLLENKLFYKINLPIGSSLFIVAIKRK